MWGCTSLPPNLKCVCAQVCTHTHTCADISIKVFPLPLLDSGIGEAFFLCPPWRLALSRAWGLSPAPEPAGSQGRIRSPLCMAEMGSPFISGLEWGAGGRRRECIRGACFHFMFNFLQA